MSQKEFQRVKVIENAAGGRLSVREASRLLQLDEELRCRVWVAWKWTKSWIGETPITHPLDAQRAVTFSIAARS